MPRTLLLAVTLLAGLAWGDLRAQAPAPDFDAISARVDPYVEKNRVVVLTDIANEPDDQMSMVRFLLYSNELDVEGLVAGTSTWMRNRVRPDVIATLIDAYARVRPNLEKHAPGYPDPAALRALVASGQTSFGMAGVGADKMTAGAELILRAAGRVDPRPLWITVWGGANTLAQALLHARSTRTPAELEALVSKLRVYAISDQDDAGPWIRREFPSLHYIAIPSTPDGDQYAMATWTGISGDRFYKNAPGADFSTFETDWVNRNIRQKGPLGKLYPYPCCIHEGDTPSFLGLTSNGLDSAMSPSFGGWGGRYVWRQFYGESHPAWTQGGDAFPGPRQLARHGGRRGRQDLHVGSGDDLALAPGVSTRLRRAHGLDDRGQGARQSQPGRRRERSVRQGADHDRRARRDADRSRRKRHHRSRRRRTDVHLVLLPGSGHRHSVETRRNRRTRLRWAAVRTPGEGGIPSAPAGLREPLPRVTIEHADRARATVTPRVAGVAHVILAVEDGGKPSLTSYRRVILQIQAARQP